MKAYGSPQDWHDDALDWQRPVITEIREQVNGAALFEEAVKYGNLFLNHEGQAILIRHDDCRIVLGFFRGKRLVGIEPRLKTSGKYELANLVLREGDAELPARLGELAAEAARLNRELGDPRDMSNY